MDAFDGLADPIRRRLIARLAGGPLTAGELCDGEAVSRPAISKHLGVLRDAGLVEAASEGRHRRYRLRPEGLASVRRYLDALDGPPIPATAFDALELEVRRAGRDADASGGHRKEIA